MDQNRVVRRGNNFRRRKKEDIQQIYGCTEEGCQKVYGDQSSLRTHMRRKHSSCIRDSPKKNNGPRAGRPPTIHTPYETSVDPSNIWDDLNFTKFLQTILTIEPCDWIRQDQDPISTFDVHSLDWSIPYKLLKYMDKGRFVFMDQKIEQLYTSIIQQINKQSEHKTRWGKVITHLLR